MTSLTDDILFFIKDQFVNLFHYMSVTVVFQPSIFLFDFPVTILDISIGLFTANAFLFFFGFLDDYDDFEVG